MLIEVPRLSAQATSQLAALVKFEDAAAFQVAVRGLPEPIKAELRAIDTALSKRLGANIAPDNPAALASVPEQHRKGFVAAREVLKTVARAVGIDQQQRIAEERLVQGQKLKNSIEP